MIDAGGEAGSANINGTQGGDPEECGGFWSFLKTTLLDACRGSVVRESDASGEMPRGMHFPFQSV